MAQLQILEFPDPRLRKVASPVTVFDEKLEVLIEDMFETMYEAQGIGLINVQISVRTASLQQARHQVAIQLDSVHLSSGL